MVVELQTQKPDKTPKTCELCEKADSTVETWVDGYLTFAHRKCAEIADKGLKLYMKFLILRLNGLEILLKDLTSASAEIETVWKRNFPKAKP